MQQRAYWDRVAREKKFTIPVSMELFNERLGDDAAILDLGCGYGRVLYELKASGFLNLAGVDLSEKMIEIAKANLPGVDLKVNTGSEISYGDGCFDAVIITAVLTCIPDDDEQKRLIAEIERVLKPGGIVYIYDFLINEDQRNLERYDKYKQKYGKYGVFELDDAVTLRHHALEWISELTSVFTELSFEEKTFATMHSHESRGFCFVGKRT